MSGLCAVFAVGGPPTAYRPRNPRATLYELLDTHFDTLMRLWRSAPRRTLSKRGPELLYWIYEVDPLDYLSMRARMRILTFIVDHKVIRQSLDHLHRNLGRVPHEIQVEDGRIPPIHINARPLPAGRSRLASVTRRRAPVSNSTLLLDLDRS